jgi:glycosyltransferase involved in cell wall biosynthesis
MWIRGPSDLPWFEFDPTVEHLYLADLDPDGMPDSDVVVYSTKLLWTALAPSGVATGRRLVEELQADRQRRWLPMLLLPGHGVFPPTVEELAFRMPGLKVCVGSWLTALLEQEGVPPRDIVHIPNGIDPEVFRLTAPIEGRAPRVAMNFDPHIAKRGAAGLMALDQLLRSTGTPATVFGTVALDAVPPSGIRFWDSPSRPVLVEEIYNTASLFLQPSRREGFGLCAVESMACGCALVTTANGGSDDYAFDGETALITAPMAGDMADALERLVRDDPLRTRLAHEGMRYVERFRWPTSADRLAAAARERLAEPEAETAPSIDLDAVIDTHRRWRAQ